MSVKSEKLRAEWFWADRWMGSSGFLLPIDARGLYREMLTQAWLRGARLPNSPEAIRRAVGVTAEEWAHCWPQIERFWRVDGAELVNDTQLEVYAKAKARYDAESERGRRAGKASAKAREQHKLNASSTQVQPVRNPPDPDQINKSVGGWQNSGRLKNIVRESLGKAGKRVDLEKVFAAATRHYAEHGEPADKIADLKARAREALNEGPQLRTVDEVLANQPAPMTEAERLEARARLRELMAGSR